MKHKLIASKNYVSKHRVAFAIMGTALFALYINRLALGQHNEFLKEHGLYDAFYALEEG